MGVERPLLDHVKIPADLRKLQKRQLRQFADELRAEVIYAVSRTGGGHLKARCRAKLAAAQERIEKIVVTGDGAVKTEPAKFE